MMPFPEAALYLFAGGLLLCVAVRRRIVSVIAPLELLTVTAAAAALLRPSAVSTAFDSSRLTAAWDLLVVTVVAVTLLLARDWRRQGGSVGHATGVAALAGGLVVVACHARDWLALGVCLDGLTVAGLRLIDDRSTPAPRRLWPAWLGSLLFWWGAALLLNLTGTWDFESARALFVDSYAANGNHPPVGSPSILGTAASVLIVAGLCLRMGVLPWSIWTLDGGTTVPLWRGACWLVLWQLAGVATLQRLEVDTLAGLEPAAITILIVCALAASFGGSALASAHDRLRSQLFGLGQVLWAWQLAGLAAVIAAEALPVHTVGGHSGQPGALGWLVLTQLTSLVTLLGFTAVWQSLRPWDRPIEHAADFTGWGSLTPLRSGLLLVFAVSLMGLWPSLAGWSRWGTLLSGLSAVQSPSEPAPHGGVRLLLLALVLPTVVAATVIFRWCRLLLLEPPLARPQRPPLTLATSTAGLLAAVLIAGGLNPSPLLRWVSLAGVRSPVARQIDPAGRPGSAESLGSVDGRAPVPGGRPFGEFAGKSPHGS